MSIINILPRKVQGGIYGFMDGRVLKDQVPSPPPNPWLATYLFIIADDAPHFLRWWYEVGQRNTRQRSITKGSRSGFFAISRGISEIEMEAGPGLVKWRESCLGVGQSAQNDEWGLIGPVLCRQAKKVH